MSHTQAYEPGELTHVDEAGHIDDMRHSSVSVPQSAPCQPGLQRQVPLTESQEIDCSWMQVHWLLQL